MEKMLYMANIYIYIFGAGALSVGVFLYFLPLNSSVSVSSCKIAKIILWSRSKMVVDG